MPEDTERLHNRDIRPRVSSSQHFNSAYDSLEPPGADACDAARTAPINSAVVYSCKHLTTKGKFDVSLIQ